MAPYLFRSLINYLANFMLFNYRSLDTRDSLLYFRYCSNYYRMLDPILARKHRENWAYRLNLIQLLFSKFSVTYRTLISNQNTKSASTLKSIDILLNSSKISVHYSVMKRVNNY
jgi:hypothetical protein